MWWEAAERPHVPLLRPQPDDVAGATVGVVCVCVLDSGRVLLIRAHEELLHYDCTRRVPNRLGASGLGNVVLYNNGTPISLWWLRVSFPEPCI